LATNHWLFNGLGDEELFEDGYFFNLSSGDIIEVSMSVAGSVEHTMEPLTRTGSLESGGIGTQQKVCVIRI
jgi:hypothetical protein